jgi:pyruvate/2-oxoglutarate dehydrogenase complex dihydrolipoamide acyltransferase (E2) component
VAPAAEDCLLVPVVKNVDYREILELAAETDDFAGRP